MHADVTVNPQRIKAFATEDRSCQRQHTTTHEFGHALGLRHYPHSRRVRSCPTWDGNGSAAASRLMTERTSPSLPGGADRAVAV